MGPKCDTDLLPSVLPFNALFQIDTCKKYHLAVEHWVNSDGNEKIEVKRWEQKLFGTYRKTRTSLAQWVHLVYYVHFGL